MLHLKVLKFGGTSVGSAQSINGVLEIVKAGASMKQIIVVSAPSGVTDLLLKSLEDQSVIATVRERILDLVGELGVSADRSIALLHELETALRLDLEANERKDLIVSFGERFSIGIVSEYFIQNGIKSAPVDAREFVITDSVFMNASYQLDGTRTGAERIFTPMLEEGITPIVTGFIGKDLQGRTTTLGRGGSDLTATLIGQCLNAEVVEIWTDADGIMTADPRKVPDAKVIEKISYKETFELSNFGAKVMQSKSLIPGFNGNVAMRVRNTFNPSASGTLISNGTTQKVFSVTSKDKISILTVFSPQMIGTPGYLARLFEIFSDLQISIDVISVSESTISVTIFNLPADIQDQLFMRVSELGQVQIKNNCSILAVVSNFLKKNQHLVPEATSLLDENSINIEMISYGNSEINLTFVVDTQEVTKALSILHSHFIKEFTI